MSEENQVITYVAKYQRAFEVQVHAPDVAIAEQLAKQVAAQFTDGSVTLLSVLPLGEPGPKQEVPKIVPPMKKPPKPFNGGSPGATVVRLPELVDQTKAA